MEAVHYRAQEILDQLGEGLQSEDADRILRFFRNYALLDEGWADYAASLILLRDTEEWQLGAQLHVPADLKRLPLIVRRGTTTPSMYGHPLGLHQDLVRSPDQ